MKTRILFLMVLGLSLINAHPTRAFGFKDQPNVVGMTDCAPTNTIDVTLTNNGMVSTCNSCPEWYISVWEWDGGTGYVRIGVAKPFSSGSTYCWLGLNWDYTNYQCLILIWKYVPTGGNTGCGYSTSDKYSLPYCPLSPTPSWGPTDFYPC